MKPRLLAEKLPKPHERRLVIIIGARQTGKTTLVKRLYPSLRYVNLDAPENRDVVRAVSTFHWARDIGPSVLDEAQKEPSVFEKVKFAFDEGHLDFTVLLGSSQILLTKRVRETLAGRAYVYELWPLMLIEVFHPDGAEGISAPLLSKVLGDTEDLDHLLSKMPSVLDGRITARLKEAEAHILRWGGMPEMLHLSSDDRRVWLRSYQYTFLERDLADLARISDLEPFKKLHKLAALRAGKLLNYSELGRDSGISVDTCRRYMEYLRVSFQAFLLQPYFENLTSSVIKTPKIYWSDMGLQRQLSGMTDSLTGEQFENYVVAEFFKWIRTSLSTCEMYFYRTRGGLEVDLLLQTPTGLIGVEIKSREEVVPSDFTALRHVAEAAGPRWRGGICVYRGQQIVQIAPHLWAIPSWRLFGPSA